MAENEKCPKCGAKVGVVGHWLGPIHSHEPNDTACLRIQLGHANAESKRFMDQYHNAADCIAVACDHMNTWAREYGVVECKSPFSHLELRELAERLWLRVMEREQKAAAQLTALKQENEALRAALEDVVAINQEPTFLYEKQSRTVRSALAALAQQGAAANPGEPQ